MIPPTRVPIRRQPITNYTSSLAVDEICRCINYVRCSFNHRFARSQTVLDVALEDHTVRLGESKCLVDRLKSVSVGREAWKDGWIYWTSENETITCSSNLLIIARIFFAFKNYQPFVIDDLEGTFWVFGHGDATSCENSIGSYGSKKKRRRSRSETLKSTYLDVTTIKTHYLPGFRFWMLACLRYEQSPLPWTCCRECGSLVEGLPARWWYLSFPGPW